MVENLVMTEVNKEMMYEFRFNTTNERVCLTQEQLDRIPYLSTLIAHNEYILNPPIYYNWFISILRSINSEQPYILFTELSESENILDTLQLFDYLGINSFSYPLLKEENLTLSEARNTAAQFIISISKNEYNLHKVDTLQSIFDLIMVIFSNNDVFSSRFRHHTLTIVTKYCLPLFSERQCHQLPTIQQIAQGSTIDSWIYLYDDDQPLPENFENAFAWKGIYTLIKNIDISNFRDYFTNILMICDTLTRKLTINNESNPHYTVYYSISRASSTIEIGNDKRICIDETQSARSRRFKTLPKRPNVDKFKCRFGPKIQKYR